MALRVLDVNTAAAYAARDNDEAAATLLSWLARRKAMVDAEQSAFSALCDRFDNLYYPEAFSTGGADHWYAHPSNFIPGRSHVSVNVYPTYVDVPAALQSVPPVENFVAGSAQEDMRKVVGSVENLYRAWLDKESFEEKVHKVCVVKGLYGRGAVKVYWDADENRPCIEVVDQPRNLYLGWRSSMYTDLEWACYVYRVSNEEALAEYGLALYPAEDDKGNQMPYVGQPVTPFPTNPYRAGIDTFDLAAEVYDYWYRIPKVRPSTAKVGKPVKFETWNALFVGNILVRNARYPEYEGKMPYVPVMNSYIPGLPNGRSELYDIEQLVREKDERMSEMAQLMSKAINGQYWQLTGPEAPMSVPPTMTPQPNRVVAPGPGNRIERIEPWMPAFQAEQYMARVDRELSDVSGLNDLLRGQAPSAVLSSSKAISALVANYETRVRMKRDLLYQWRRDVWSLAQTMWGRKNAGMREVFAAPYTHEIEPPSLTPRDDQEAAMIAGNLSTAKLWSQERAMYRVGVDDPATEQDLIRQERTDATLFPADVQVQVSLLAVMQQLQSQMAQQQAMQQQAQGQGGVNPQQAQEQSAAALRASEGGLTGQPSMNGPGEQPTGGPPPANTPEGQANATPSQLLNQYQIKGGQANNRLVGQQQIQREGP